MPMGVWRMSKVIVACVYTALSISVFAQSPIKAQPFPLADVRLLPGPLADDHKAGVDYLLQLDPDRLLSGFRTSCGLQPKAQPYGGWESMGFAGHTVGHYLTACSQEFAASRNPAMKIKVDYVIAGLGECMKNRPDGYLSAVVGSDRMWNDIRSGNIQANEFDLNGLWSPWAVQSCVLSGLIDAHKYAKSGEALVIATKMADWAYETTKRFDDDMWQSMLLCEVGGMAKSLADLSVFTKNRKYLDLAAKFYDRKTLDPLTQAMDNLEGLSTSVQTAKITGVARIFELTNNSTYGRAAKFFWYSVVKHHTYITGGMGLGNYFGKPDSLGGRLGSAANDLSSSSHFLDLTKHLFEWDARPEIADYYEHALITSILGSHCADLGRYSENIPLNVGGFRFFDSPFDSFSEAHGTGMESQTRLQDGIYYHAGTQRLYVNQYVPSELSWLGQRLRQETTLPDEDKVSFKITGGVKQPYEIAFRHPGWEKSPVQVKVNGVVLATSTRPSSYILVKRVWWPGDQVEITFPLAIQLTPMADNPRVTALTYGPVVLAADLGPSTKALSKPILFSQAQIASLTKDANSIAFTSRDGTLTFRPLASLRDRRYAIYVEPLSDAEMIDARRAYDAEAARKKEIESRTVDFVSLGDRESEASHKFQDQRTIADVIDERSYRAILTEGSIDVELKSDSSLPVQLIVTYWGSERIRPDFSVLANGSQLALERLQGRPTNQFFEVIYKIPEEATQGNRTLKVEFLATPTKFGPLIAEIRVVRAKG